MAGAAVIGGRRAISALLAMRVRPLETMDSLVAEHGGVVELRIPGAVYLLVAEPDAIEQVLKPPDPEAVHKGQAIQRARRILGDGLLTADGPGYLRRRRLAQPAFQPRRLGAYVAVMVRHAGEACDAIVPGETIDIEAAMDAMALRVAGEAMFGVEFDASREARIHAALAQVRSCFIPGLHPLAPMLERLPLPIVRRFERAKRELLEMVDWIIEARRRDPEASSRTDLLSLLLAATDDDGSSLSDAELRDEAMVLLLAGHETTANALAWTMYLLAANHAAQERLHEHVRGVLGGRDEPEEDDLPRLELVRAAFDEALRLFPSGSVIARRTLEPLDLTWDDRAGETHGHRVAAGTEIMLSQWTSQHDRRWYGDDAEAFRPERMLDAAARSRHRYAFVAFGGGRRVCIGRAFARQQATIAVSMLLARYRFELPPGTEPPARNRVEIGFTLRPLGGMRLIAAPR